MSISIRSGKLAFRLPEVALICIGHPNNEFFEHYYFRDAFLFNKTEKYLYRSYLGFPKRIQFLYAFGYFYDSFSSQFYEFTEVVNSVKTSGVPDDIKGILNAPVRGVKTFLNEAKSVIQTVKNETAARFSGIPS